MLSRRRLVLELYRQETKQRKRRVAEREGKKGNELVAPIERIVCCLKVIFRFRIFQRRDAKPFKKKTLTELQILRLQKTVTT